MAKAQIFQSSPARRYLLSLNGSVCASPRSASTRSMTNFTSRSVRNFHFGDHWSGKPTRQMYPINAMTTVNCFRSASSSGACLFPTAYQTLDKLCKELAAGIKRKGGESLTKIHLQPARPAFPCKPINYQVSTRRRDFTTQRNAYTVGDNTSKGRCDTAQDVEQGIPLSHVICNHQQLNLSKSSDAKSYIGCTKY